MARDEAANKRPAVREDSDYMTDVEDLKSSLQAGLLDARDKIAELRAEVDNK